LDTKGRLIIADFGFAIQLLSSPISGSAGSYEQLIPKTRIVGSEEYNAPEIIMEEASADHLFTQA
jgi:serine/threonine protein kinase